MGKHNNNGNNESYGEWDTITALSTALKIRILFFFSNPTQILSIFCFRTLLLPRMAATQRDPRGLTQGPTLDSGGQIQSFYTYTVAPFSNDRVKKQHTGVGNRPTGIQLKQIWFSKQSNRMTFCRSVGTESYFLLWWLFFSFDLCETVSFPLAAASYLIPKAFYRLIHLLNALQLRTEVRLPPLHCSELPLYDQQAKPCFREQRNFKCFYLLFV